MENGLKIKTRLPASPEAIYRAWLSGSEHSAMTGAKATASSKPGGSFTAWDGYIRGKNLELKPYWCIVQSWRTTKFADGDPDSRLELCIHPSGDGSELVLIHTEIPPDQLEGYQSGWVEYYFDPMRAHFSAKQRKKPAKKSAGKATRKAAKKKAAGRKTAKKRAAKKKPVKRRTRR